MPNQIQIREAAIPDAELIADISRDTFYAAFAPANTREDMDQFMQEQFTREKLVAEVGAPGNFFYLAYIDHAVVGYIKLREGKIPEGLLSDQVIEIARIYSISAKTGKGIGSALMQHAIDIATQKNKKQVWLGVWEHNEGAIRFYERWGFEKFGSHEFILGSDRQTDWLMKKDLTIL